MIAGLCLAAAGIASASTVTLEIRAWIDGRDNLIIQRSNLTWQHFEWMVPGVQEGHNDPTWITTTKDGVAVDTNRPWFPSWSNGTGPEAYSDSFIDLNPALTNALVTNIEVISARSSAGLVQIPSPDNGFSTTVSFNDSAPWGAEYYDVRLTFITQPDFLR